VVPEVSTMAICVRLWPLTLRQLPDRDQRAAVIADVEVLDSEATAVEGVREVEVEVTRCWHRCRVERRKELVGLTRQGGERPADVEAVVDEVHVGDHTVGLRCLEVRHHGTGRGVDLATREVLAAPLTLAKAPPTIDGAVAGVHHLVHLGCADVGPKGVVQRTGGRVEGEDAVACHCCAAGGGHLRELARPQ
jgi:hypothetical protein